MGRWKPQPGSLGQSRLFARLQMVSKMLKPHIPTMALLEGFSTPLQLSGNGSARLNLVLTQISGQTAPVFQLFGNIDGFSHLNPKSANGHSDSYTTLLTQTPKPLTYQLRAFVENAYSGGELQVQAVLTYLDV
ncbi:hypothetical protein OAK20_02225 [Synechococcus sp. AH-551-P21]|nr:hypothetical protein [Synechococcus sp. AH-551-P21]